MIAPLVEERKACQRVLYEMASRMAANGTAVLRFDLRGCGDSTGAFDTFSLPDWQADIAAAAARLRLQYPLLPQFMLGVRFGAELALRSQISRDGLILIDPVTGPEFIRQIQQRNLVNQMVAFGKARHGRADMTAIWQSGATVDLDGFAISARLWNDLLAPAPAPAPSPATLIISTGPDTTTINNCQRLLPTAELVALRLPAYWNTVGHIDVSGLQQAVQTWTDAQAHTLTSKAALEIIHPEVPNDTPADGMEQLVSIRSNSGTLRGVLHVPPPLATASNPHHRRIIFLAGWSGDRTGPHRMFVHAARHLTAAGHTCLRFDYCGRGDGDGATADATITSMSRDTRNALAWLRTFVPDRGPLTMVAICSGCKVALTVAAEVPDVKTLILWSAESMGSLRATGTNRRKTAHALRVYVRKLLRLETWRKLLRGHIRADMIRKAVIQHETRSVSEARHEDEVLKSFQSFDGRLLFIFGGSDPDAPGSLSAYQDFCTQHDIVHTCQTVPHAGHSYYAAEWERAVIAATINFVNDR